MRNLLSYTVVLLIVAAGVTAIGFVSSQTAYASTTTDEMSQILGGGECQACINFCGGSGCPGSRCDDEGGDSGELCGSYDGEGAAWGCGGWGSAEENCTLAGDDDSCTGRTCNCTSNGNCRYNASTSHSGKEECSD